MLLLGLLALVWQGGAQDWQARGSKALDDKRYAEAAEAFQKAAEADPKDYSAFFNLALAKSLLGDDAAAISNYEHVLELKPALYEAELNLGILFVRGNRPGDAAALLTHAAEQRPKEFRPAYFLAEALLRSGKNTEAEHAFQTALTLDPRSAAAEAGLAQTLVALGRLDESAPHFRKAAELDASYHNEILRLGEAYEAAKQLDQALAIYTQFTENPGAQERAGQILLGQGRSADAVPHLEAAVKLAPSAANRTALAAAYANAKQFDKAAPILADALRAEPRNYELRMMAGRLLRDSRKYAEAAAQFFEATKTRPDSVEAWNDLAAVLVLAEQYPQAVAALDRLRALGAETTAHHYLRALCFDHMNIQEQALDAYRKFLAASNGKHPDEEFKARQRARILEKEIKKR